MVWTSSRVVPLPFPGQTASFQSCMSASLLPAQLIGLFPVHGLLSPDPADLRYSWTSWRALASYLAILGTGLMAAIGTYWFLLNITMFRATKVVFYGTAVTSCVLLHRLARGWPRLGRLWRTTERLTSHIGYPRHTVLYCRVFTVVYFTIAIVEHGFAVVNALVHIVQCSRQSVFRQFFSRWFPQLLTVVPYSPLLGPPVLFFNTIATFTFSYLDLLISNVTYCLSAMFRQFNVHITQVADKEFPRPDWGQLHRDYQALRVLASTVDCHISDLVLLSFIINIYHICLQLYLSLGALPTLASKVYFCLSFGFLMLRTTTVCLSAAAIHDQAAMPKYVLFSVPPHEFDEQVERFLFQVCNDPVAISGLNFFVLTRKTLVTVIGLAITYEVVMFQIQTMAEEEDDLKEGVVRNVTMRLCLTYR